MCVFNLHFGLHPNLMRLLIGQDRIVGPVGDLVWWGPALLSQTFDGA